jgi:hypothetical protein
MKKDHITKIGLLLGGAVAFNLLFWKEHFGINLALYSILLVVLSLVYHPEARKSTGVRVAVGGILITGGMIVFHNSFMTKFVHFTSLLVFIGFVNQPKLRAIFHALSTGIVNLVLVPQMIVSHLSSTKSNNRIAKRSWRTTKLIVLPFLFFLLFYVIFYFSNPVFADYSDQFWNAIGNWFENIFQTISILWILLFIAGVIITGWSIFKADIPYFSKLESRLVEIITRKKKGERRPKRANFIHIVGLKNEFRSALFLVIPINILLFVVNIIDVNWIWFNFEYDGKANLSAFVHEGTYLLIFSILLSIGILLFFFRRNLNFFPRKKTLVLFANIWIFQNLILVISVGIRNYHYIHYYGLAYKRIGVIFFLIATLVGLVTLFIKIREAKTSYYLLRVNSWFVYGLLITMSCVNWDNLIVNHNLNHELKKNIDVQFLLSLSDKTLPILDANREKLHLDGRYHYRFGGDYESYLDLRINQFMERKENATWKSWNYNEDKAYHYFKSKGS